MADDREPRFTRCVWFQLGNTPENRNGVYRIPPPPGIESTGEVRHARFRKVIFWEPSTPAGQYLIRWSSQANQPGGSWQADDGSEEPCGCVIAGPQSSGGGKLGEIVDLNESVERMTTSFSDEFGWFFPLVFFISTDRGVTWARYETQTNYLTRAMVCIEFS